MQTDEFVVAAGRFIRFVDDSDALAREAFVREIQPIVLDVYAAGIVLEHDYSGDELEPSERMTADEWWSLYRRLQRQLGNFDSIVDGSLSDDIADIYRDLIAGFVPFDSGDVGEAVWEWRFGFDSHWGRHAAHAVYALHVLRSEYLS